ncbi:EamA family transporter [Cryobacterium sp. Hz7]|uniref:EamA family transporter n=1 Tax=Cryobacterium sandaracinum TaxID=1259247 RepID=A0ABY2JLG0_9MICO|nr:DMT family transporter [Cryobacterium sp. Hz7]TFB58172.1 EamA family transporter [Cryobacterium sp. Hz7]TFC66009.1 EamA family transporter [Cryobacterium sp. TMT2-4]TFD06413.1 EamA family transporter [Cryobacterium sandaracinum]
MVTPPRTVTSRLGVAPIFLAALLWGTTGTAAHFLPVSASPLATKGSHTALDTVHTGGSARHDSADHRPAVGPGRRVRSSGRSARAARAIGPMFVAYLLFGRGPRTVCGSTATSLTLVEPLVATLLAVLIVGERLPPSGWAGLGLVLVAVTALAVPRNSGQPSSGGRTASSPVG